MTENNAMPTMPGANNNATEEKVNTSLPGEQDLPTQKIVTPGDTDHSIVKTPKAPKKGIEVVATRKGFYNQKRLLEGDKFKVKDFEALGNWMKCVDLDLERKRKEYFNNKKAKK